METDKTRKDAHKDKTGRWAVHRLDVALVLVLFFAWTVVWIVGGRTLIPALGLLYAQSMMVPFVGVGVLVGMVASLLLLRSRTFRFIPLALLTGIASLVMMFTVANMATHTATQTYRYRFGVDIETAAGLVSESSMFQVTRLPNPLRSIFPSTEEGGTVRGEGIFLDLGGGHSVVVFPDLPEIFANDTAWVLLPWWAAGHDVGFRDVTLPELEGRIELTGKYLPAMAFFLDNARLDTVRLFTPKTGEEALGPGYAVESVWVELTDDPYQPSNMMKMLRDGRSKEDWNALRSKLYSMGLRSFLIDLRYK